MHVLLAAVLVAAGPFSGDLEARRVRLLAERARPEAAVALLDVVEPWLYVEARRIEQIARLGSHARAHPLVRLAASTALAAIDRRFGRFDEAAARRRGAGMIERWRIVGAFEDASGAGLARRDGPEDDARAEASVGGHVPAEGVRHPERPLSWREPPAEVVTTGALPLGALVHPDRAACAYAAAFVRAPRELHAAVRVGSSGPVRVWVGGDLVLERDDLERPARPDQDAAAIRLDAGWNRVLVKSCVREGRWETFVRLTDPAGRPLPIEVAASPPPQGASLGGGRAAHPVETLRAALEERTRARPGSPEAWADLGRFHLFVSPDGPRKRDAIVALERAAALRADPEIFRLLARAAEELDEKRRFLERGLAAPSSRLLVELGDVYQGLSRERQAREWWQRAQALDPHDVVAALRLAAALEAAGLQELGLAALREVEARFPEAWAARLAVAHALERRDLRDEAGVRVRAYLAVAADEVDAWRTLLGIERARGDAEAAIRAAEGMRRARPDVASIAVDLCELLAAAGRADEARAAIDGALVVAPDAAWLHERRGRLLLSQGATDAGIAALEQSLRLQPQNAELRRWIDRLRPAAPSHIERFRRNAADVLASSAGFTGTSRRHARSARAFRASSPTGAGPASRAEAARPTASAETLWDLTAIDVHPSGLARTLRQRFVRVLDERGAREYAEFAIRHTPSTQEVDVRAARVHRAGQAIEAPRRWQRELSEPWYGLYYDYRAEVIGFADLRPGDVIELEYVVEDRASHNELGDYWGDLFLLQEEIPVRAAEIVVALPRARTLHFNEPRLPGVLHAVEETSDTRVYRWSVANAPGIEADPGMPGWTEVAAYLHVSTYASWAQVASWYRGLLREALVPDEEVRRAAREAVLGIEDPRERVRAIYRLVVRRTRYVGLEFGIHGYRPYRVPLVWARKFGDCKDKASLLVAMLREIGVEATLVLVRTRRGGDIDDRPASLAIFDHAIAYVPSQELYLDGTAEFHGAEELPAQDQGVRVLHVDDGTMRVTPIADAAKNRVERTLRFALAPAGRDHADAGGRARVEETLRLVGQAAPAWRQHYEAADQRRERYERAWNARFAGARVERVEMEVEDLARPVLVRAEVSIIGLARPAAADGQAWLLPASAREGELVRSYARASVRRHDLVLDYPWEQLDRYEYQAPAGLRLSSLPAPRRIESAFGSFEMSATGAGPRVSVMAFLRVSAQRIRAADYADFRAFLGKVDEAMGQELRLEPAQ
ncbi:MAG: DUF3857 domain-containing protein [Myxococcota bacterium]